MASVRLALLTTIAACIPASQPASLPPDPELSLTRHALESGTCETRLRMFFVLKNTRFVPLTVSRYEATLTHAAVSLATETGALGLSLQPNDEASFDVALPVPRCGDVAGRVDVTGKLYGDAGEEIIFEFEDSETLPPHKPPELGLELRGQRNEDKVELFLLLRLFNPNNYGVAVDGIDFGVKLNGKTVATGRALENERVRDLTRSTYEVPLEIDPAEPALATLKGHGKLPYEIETILHMGDAQKADTLTGVFSF